MVTTESVQWKGRDGICMTNGIAELSVLADGGHLAEFRFVKGHYAPSVNVLWDAPWMDSKNERQGHSDELSQTGGFTGHGLCLDYFGPPSPTESALGFPIHGEAAARRWSLYGDGDAPSAVCRCSVALPNAKLLFERSIHLRDMESVLYVEETVSNQQDMEHPCHWVQHATFSPPFLDEKHSTVAVSATNGITSPHHYEGGALLAVNQRFRWPYAPGTSGGEVDLRIPFSAKGGGYLAAVRLDPVRSTEFMAAMNWELRLGVGYCFRQHDFPWITIWEENCARSDKPWNGNTQARGMEFGTTPLPLGREETRRRGRIFDTATWRDIPPHGRLTARYVLFLFVIPEHVRSIQNIAVNGNQVDFFDESPEPSFSITARGSEAFLSTKYEKANLSGVQNINR